MSLWSDISSAIGSVFGGGNNSAPAPDPNNPLKKNQNIIPTTSNLVSQKVNLPTRLIAPKPIALPVTQPTPPVVVPMATPTSAQQFDVNNLPKSNIAPTVAPQRPIISTNAQPVSGDQTIEDLAGAGVGGILGIARAGTGIVQGTLSLPDLIAHGANYLTSKVTGKPESTDANNPMLNALDLGTHAITAPLNTVNQKLDQAAQAYGPGAEASYKPAQIATNVVTALPAVESAANKLPDVINAIKNSGLALDDSGHLSWPGSDKLTPQEYQVGAQQRLQQAANNKFESGGGPNPSADRTANNKIAAEFNRNPQKFMDKYNITQPPSVDDTAPATTDNTPPETGTKVPDEVKPTNAPAGDTGTPTTAPGATESGVKPVEIPPTPSITDKINALPTEETPPVEATPTPAPVAAEQAAVQNAVDKTAANIPAPVAPPATATADITPEQAAAEVAAQKQVTEEAPALPAKGKRDLLDYVDKKGDYSPEAQATRTAEINKSGQDALNEVANKSGVKIEGATETPKDTANVKFEQTENPLKSDEVKPQDAQPFGVKRMEANREPDEEPHQLKKQGTIIKAKAIRTQLRKLGPRSREFLSHAENENITKAKILTQEEKGLSVYDLSPKQIQDVGDVVEGKITSTDPAVNKAADELKPRYEETRQALNSTGENVPERTNFMPHNIDDKQFTDPKIFKDAVDNLVKNGVAPDRASATELLNKQRYEASQEHGSSLTSSRKYNVQNYKHTAQGIHEYFDRAAGTMARNMQYGKDGKVLDDLIDRASAKGEDATNLKRLMDEVLHPKVRDSGKLGPVANAVNRGTNLVFLPKAALSHLGQGMNTLAKVGPLKYGKAILDNSFSDDDKAFLDRQGFNADKNAKLEGNFFSRMVNKGTAPGIRQVLKWHSNVAALGGKSIAEGLAKAGNEEALRAMGVTGDLERDAGGKISLTDDQLGQAAHNLVNHTIFSHSPLESPTWTKSILGKFIGQFKQAYTYKEGGFIHDLITDAGKGNVAPLLRYLGVAVPAAGITVAGAKNLVTTGRPIKPGQSLSNFASQALSDSGVGAIGGGVGNDIYSTLAYNYNNNYRYQNAASAVAPVAGVAVETGQNAYSALQGNNKPIIKQGISMIPVGGTALKNKLYPATKYTPAQQKFNTAWDANYPKAVKSLSPSFSQSANPTAVKQDEKTRDIFTSLVQSDHTSTGATILKTPKQTMAQAANAVAYPQALQAYQKLEQSLPNHNPVYDLPTTAAPGQPSLTTYEQYESIIKGDPNRTVLEQQNPWLINTFNQEQTWFNKQGTLSNTVEPKGYIPYPPITSSQSDMMTQLTNLSSIPNRTPAQETSLDNLENNPDLQKAYTLLDNYTNANRKAEGVSPIPYPTENLTPAMNDLLAKEEALPSDTGAKTALINANLTLWNQAQAILAQTTEYAANEYGAVVDQGGKEPNLLKDQYELGQEDIAKGTNAAGDTNYVLNPNLAYNGGTGGGYTYGSGSGTSASAAAYDRDKAAGLIDDASIKQALNSKTSPGLKAGTKKYVAPKLLVDKAPTGKNGNPLAQAISYTGGVKSNKGSNPFGNKISAVAGSKAV